MNSTNSFYESRILILDFGSQYTQLIARRIREIGVYCEIYPYHTAQTKIENFAPQGIILSGGPQTVTKHKTPRAPEIVFKLGCPVLGICYGMQIIAQHYGGLVESKSQGEFGYARVDFQENSLLFNSIPSSSINVWMSHGDHIAKLPQDFKQLAKSSNGYSAAIADLQRNFYGLQFHPEVNNTEHGKIILQNFVETICGCKKRWKPENIIEEGIAQIRKKIGSDEVLLAVSGGVDSSVLAALLHKAIPEQLHCVFIDNGLLRRDEREQVMNSFAKQLGIKVHCIDAADRFLQALKGVTDPEDKRKIIGREFVTVFEKHAKKFNRISWLAQGTIYPDIVESGKTQSHKTAVIKSHHNVGGLPDRMDLKLLEPLKELFKDEVRAIGLQLGVPQEIINRHPFPGPGLAIRILGEVKKSHLEILRHADALFLEELHKHKLYDKVNQAFAVFLPIKSIGVKGDARCYDYVIALRAVETVDFMTAQWSPLPHDFLATISNRILNEVKSVSRVTYDISTKPPATIEWE